MINSLSQSGWLNFIIKIIYSNKTNRSLWFKQVQAYKCRSTYSYPVANWKTWIPLASRTPSASCTKRKTTTGSKSARQNRSKTTSIQTLRTHSLLPTSLRRSRTISSCLSTVMVVATLRRSVKSRLLWENSWAPRSKPGRPISPIMVMLTVVRSLCEPKPLPPPTRSLRWAWGGNKREI